MKELGIKLFFIGLIGNFLNFIIFGIYGSYIQLNTNDPLFSWPWNRSAEVQSIMGWALSILIGCVLLQYAGVKLINASQDN
jgi:hypothetical protein